MPPVLVTLTNTLPPDSTTGVVAVIVDESTTVNEAAAVPLKLTPVTFVKFCPDIVIAVPPVAKPEFGVTDVTTELT